MRILCFSRGAISKCSCVLAHGDGAVFLARFLGPAAKVTPFFAGASGMAFQRFLTLELIPPLCTIPLNVGIGYGIGVGISFLRVFAGDRGVLIFVPIVVFALCLPLFLVYMHHQSFSARRDDRGDADYATCSTMSAFGSKADI